MLFKLKRGQDIYFSGNRASCTKPTLRRAMMLFKSLEYGRTSISVETQERGLVASCTKPTLRRAMMAIQAGEKVED